MPPSKPKPPPAKPAPATPFPTEAPPRQRDMQCFATFATPDGAKRCTRNAFAKGFCYTHYMRLHRGGNPNLPIRARTKSQVPLPKTMVSADAGDDFRQEAKRLGKSEYAMLQQIVEAWHEQRVKYGIYRPVELADDGGGEEIPEELEDGGAP